MDRTPGTAAVGADFFFFFYKIHNTLVTIDKTRYLSEACRGNRGTKSHIFQYHSHNAFTDELKLSFSPGTIVTWNGLTTHTISKKTVDGFKSKI